MDAAPLQFEAPSRAAPFDHPKELLTAAERGAFLSARGRDTLDESGTRRGHFRRALCDSVVIDRVASPSHRFPEISDG